MELIGILIIIIGFALKLDVIAVILCSGLITGLISGMSIVEILSILGKAFVDNRYMSLFLLILGVIGILERNGLRESASELIKKINKATSGKVLSAYVVVRTILAALSIRIQGHVQFIRPLIYPMAKGANDKNLDEKEDEKLKGICNSVENYGNFFGQNIFIASPGVLLIVGTLKEKGITTDPYHIALASIPIAFVVVFYSIIQNYFLDKSLKAKK